MSSGQGSILVLSGDGITHDDPACVSFSNSSGVGVDLCQRSYSRRTLVGVLDDELVFVMKVPVSLNAWSSL